MSEHFSCVFIQESADEDVPRVPLRDIPHLQDTEINAKIQEVIVKMKSNESPGPDQILSRVLKKRYLILSNNYGK